MITVNNGTDDTNFVEFKDVGKSFGALTVLQGLNLSVKKGERISLIGPSGSGKTTILRLLMTLEKLTAGTIWVAGQPLFHEISNGALVPATERHISAIRGRIGMVFQHFNLFPHMTALKNVARPQMLAKGVGSAEAHERAETLLARVGLASKSGHYPTQLSGGQKQRVAIARALAMQPEIMLFDEATSALDPELVEEVQDTIRDISTTSDMTMLFVTHEMSFAREISDRVLFLDSGRIVEQGPPEQLFGAPVEERTKTFLRKILAAGQRLT